MQWHHLLWLADEALMLPVCECGGPPVPADSSLLRAAADAAAILRRCRCASTDQWGDTGSGSLGLRESRVPCRRLGHVSWFSMRWRGIVLPEASRMLIVGRAKKLDVRVCLPASKSQDAAAPGRASCGRKRSGC